VATKTQQIPIGGKLTLTQPQQLSTAELSALYDRIYDIADRLFKKYNPCKIHTKDGKSHCAEYHNNRSYNTNRLCCSGCGEYPQRDINHWSKIGCTTKCLACKLYSCPTIYRQKNRFNHQLSRLKRFADKHGLSPNSYYFISKEKWFEQRNKQW